MMDMMLSQRGDTVIQPIKKLIAEMGTKWIGHPDNHIKRKTDGTIS